MTTKGMMKSNGKQVFIESEDPLVIDAINELNHRSRGRKQRLERLAAAGAPAITFVEYITEPLPNPGPHGPYNRILNAAEVRAANEANHKEHERLKAWLELRIGASLESKPGNSGQFNSKISTIHS